MEPALDRKPLRAWGDRERVQAVRDIFDAIAPRYDLLNRVIPVVGGVISGDLAAYRYLPNSIQDFLLPDDLSILFQKADLRFVQAFPLTFGLTYVHEGYR